MTYSFTQISRYLRCPRQYRYRSTSGSIGARSAIDLLFLDGWDLGCFPGRLRSKERTGGSIFADNH